MRQNRGGWTRTMRWIGALAAVMANLIAAEAAAIMINVKTPDGQSITTGFRYTIEEDRTYDVIPGCTGITPAPAGCPQTPGPALSLNFHRSYMPVVETGESGGPSIGTSVVLDPTKRYFVSVLPMANGLGEGIYAMGGAPVKAGQTSVDVVVDVLPLKSAQISILLFNDDNPINNAVDAPPAQERGLCGFEVHLYDAGGTYGASGGRIFADAFGNPLGTTYQAAPPYNVVSMGNAILKTDVNGVLRIQNLAPAKYTVFALPPMQRPSETECAGVYQDENGTDPTKIRWGKWSQTSTIEGTWGIDAWVKAGEPSFFKEFGPPGHHVAMGFVRKFSNVNAGTGPSKVSGKVVNVHMSRPPNFAFYNGEVVDQCWVGLNEVAAGVGGARGVYAGPCNPDGSFEIVGLRRNTQYQLAVWDTPLDQVFALYNFVTPDSGDVALNDVPVFRWFGKWEGKVCYDQNGNGFCEEGEPGIPGQAVNLRFRDGSIYQAGGTDESGNYELTEIFPFFNWMVTEIDFARFKATGATVVVDGGGPVPADDGWAMPSRNKLNPQQQCAPDNPNCTGVPYRTETGPVLLQGMQTFLGTTNLIEWGKQPYSGNDNGGISGIVYYASTRAENDPRFTAGENNEPGIPGVTVRLYRAKPSDRRAILDVNGDGVINASDAVAEVQTDSWDENLPTGCAGDNQMADVVARDACFDGLRNYNQVRPALFDGGYAFVDYEPAGVGSGNATQLVPGNYIVEVVPPAGYEIQKEEDKNVDFGEYFDVAMQALPPECVGSRTLSYDGRPPVGPVPSELTLFPGVAIPSQYRDAAGKPRPYCNQVAVTLTAQQNAPANFYLFTKAPVAAHITGMILDDLANEFSPFSPAFGEKYGPPYMPVSLRDQAGREFSRVYSDRHGTYNALVPSTFSYNVPMPSGVSPNMVQACLNSPYMPDPANPGQFKLDPHFNKSYTQFCYTFQYLPGKTTYLDTPVLPIAAFAGPQQFALDCEAPHATPGIRSVTNLADQGPWVAAAQTPIVITSLGPTEVLNPLYNQDNPAATNPLTGIVEPKLITRDFGFGATPGEVLFVTGAGTPAETTVAVPVAAANWSDAQITVAVPDLGVGTASATVLVRRPGTTGGRTTPRGVTLHIGGVAPRVVLAGQKIQDAIDAAAAGDLITVAPGMYEESVILHKRVRLQGFGAGGTLINAVKQPTESQQQWRNKVCGLVLGPNGGQFLLPGQAIPASPEACRTGNTIDNAPLLFGNDEGAGVFVMIRSGDLEAPALQVDGFTISGADQGGGLMVNGHAGRIEIANNRITGNHGIEGGGIRIGHANLTEQFANGEQRYVGSRTPNLTIHHNEVVQNGNTAGAAVGGGGGISLFNGADGYRVTSNFVCGNYSTGDGGGIAHIGLSAATAPGTAAQRTPTIERNLVLFNQSFNQGTNPNGGGLAITGLQSLVTATGISTGTGSVLVNANTFQGNLAGAGDGGGVSLAGVNGSDATTPERHRIDIVNNVIDNNVAGVAGGGIALQDAVDVRIVNNTISHNDSVATGSRAFSASVTQSTPQPGAGVAARTHSPALSAIAGGLMVNGLSQQAFSNPVVHNSIVQNNRMFYWQINTNVDQTNCLLNTTGNTCYGLVPNLSAANTEPVFSDLAVIGGGALTATYSMLTATSVSPVTPASADNLTTDPLLRCTYSNGGRDAVINMNETTAILTAAAFDEGGNFIDARFGPVTQLNPTTLAPYGDLRIRDGSPANDSALPFAGIAALGSDRIGIARGLSGWSRGAFEGGQAVPACGP